MSGSGQTTQIRWREEEDRILRAQVKRYTKPGQATEWNRVAEELAGRTNKDCRKRWINHACGGLKKGPWEAEEDGLLREAVARHGQKWTLVAAVLVSRSADQCAKRWQHNLDPKLDREKWTPKEDELLLESVRRYGREWRKIQEKHYTTRSANDLKNRFSILSKRMLRSYPTFGQAVCSSATVDRSQREDGRGTVTSSDSTASCEDDRDGDLGSMELDDSDMEDSIEAVQEDETVRHEDHEQRQEQREGEKQQQQQQQQQQQMQPYGESLFDMDTVSLGQDMPNWPLLDSPFSSLGKASTAALSQYHGRCHNSPSVGSFLDFGMDSMAADAFQHSSVPVMTQWPGNTPLPAISGPLGTSQPDRQHDDIFSASSGHTARTSFSVSLPTLSSHTSPDSAVEQDVIPMLAQRASRLGKSGGTVCLRADGCDRELLDYLLDVLHPIRHLVKIEVNM